jgi:DNA-binding CsgD family transcriptional regulator
MGLPRLPDTLPGPASRRLSERELQVLALAAHGATYSDISAVLGIAKHTVESHLVSARTKLGALHTTHACWLGYKQYVDLL